MVDFDFYQKTYRGSSQTSSEWSIFGKRAEEQLARYKRIYTVTAPDESAEAKLVVFNCTTDARAQGPAQCIMGTGQISVDKSVATARSSRGYVKTIFAISGNANISDTTINATTLASDSYADGIYNDFGCVLTVRDSKILADAQGVNASTGSLAIACLNLGTAYFDNAEVNGTHSGKL